MRGRPKYLAGAVCLVMLLFSAEFSFVAGQTIYEENFERGAQSQVDKIRRYPMSPEIVSYDNSYPGAFPPPSGTHAVKAQDQNRSYNGLGSVVAGPVIDLNDPQMKYAEIQAKLYLTSSNDFQQANQAIIAVNNQEKVERYYRFGYGDSSIYFHYFDGSNFTESLFDPQLASQLRIPGWHTFSMRFDGPAKIFCYVDGKQTFFTPVRQSDVNLFRLGALGWDRQRFRPILADDFKVILHSEPPKEGASGADTGPTDTQPQGQGQSPFFTQNTGQINWFTDTSKAVAKARGTGRKFLVLFYLPGQPQTSMVEQNLSDPSVRNTVSQLVPVKLNGKVYQGVAKRYGIYKYPTLIVIDMAGRIYWEYKGVVSVRDINRSLARF